MSRSSYAGTLALGIIAALVCCSPVQAGARSGEEICDATADYFLGAEDYSQAVESHRRVIAAHPEDALAHYHLGFAYGMMSRQSDELAEYREAASLGLRKWDLFLNLGRLYLEKGDLAAAAEALRTATTLGPSHPEGHFNLGLAYERQGALAQARDEMLTSLRLDHDQSDARNMLGLIAAEQGDVAQARRIWSELVRSEPDFEPARANLALLEGPTQPSHDTLSASPNAFRTASICGSR